MKAMIHCAVFLILSGALGLASDNGLVCIPKGVLSGIDEDFGVVCITNSKALLMDRTEVTQSLWKDIYSWALTNNYEFPSDVNQVGANGSNYPVHAVTFGVAVLWCNARSEKNGLAPCFINNAGTGIKKYSEPISRCSLSASGFRLPTPQEWEYAARGLTCTRFHWGNAISYSNANFTGWTNCYEVSTVAGRAHPVFAKGRNLNVLGDAATSPVMSFQPNRFGLYDMSGNVSEWCWDNETPYDSSRWKVTKGGSWRTPPQSLRPGNIEYLDGGGQHVWAFNSTGFRCVRVQGGRGRDLTGRATER